MTLYDGGNKYVMSGFSATNNSFLKYEMETIGTASSCAEPVEHSSLQDEATPSINHEIPFSSMTGMVRWNKVESVKRYVAVTIECR